MASVDELHCSLFLFLIKFFKVDFIFFRFLKFRLLRTSLLITMFPISKAGEDFGLLELRFTVFLGIRA